MSERVGFWADMENPYVTYDNNYIESEWWALKTIWDKGMLCKDIDCSLLPKMRNGFIKSRSSSRI